MPRGAPCLEVPHPSRPVARSVAPRGRSVGRSYTWVGRSVGRPPGLQRAPHARRERPAPGFEPRARAQLPGAGNMRARRGAPAATAPRQVRPGMCVYCRASAAARAAAPQPSARARAPRKRVAPAACATRGAQRGAGRTRREVPKTQAHRRRRRRRRRATSGRGAREHTLSARVAGARGGGAKRGGAVRRRTWSLPSHPVPAQCPVVSAEFPQFRNPESQFPRMHPTPTPLPPLYLLALYRVLPCEKGVHAFCYPALPT
jgi:hypothetical protein